MLAKKSKKKARRQQLTGLKRNCKILAIPITEMSSGKTSKRSSVVKETR